MALYDRGYQSLESETYDPYGQEYLAPGTIGSLAKIYAPSMNRDAAVKTLLALGGRQRDIDAAVQGLYFQGETPPAASPTGALSTATTTPTTSNTTGALSATAPTGYDVFGLNWNPTADLATKQGYIQTLLGKNITPEQLKTRIAEFDPANATQEVYTALGIPAGTATTAGALTTLANAQNDLSSNALSSTNWQRTTVIGNAGDERTVAINPVTGEYVNEFEYLNTAKTPEALAYQNRLSTRNQWVAGSGLDERTGTLLYENLYSGPFAGYTDPIKSTDYTQGVTDYLSTALKNQGITSYDQVEVRFVPGDAEAGTAGQTKFFNRTTGQEINPVLFDDKAGTRYVLTESGIQKDVDLGKRIGTQIAALGYLDPTSSGGAWTTQSGSSSGPGFGVEGMFAQLGQRLAQDAGLTDINDLGVRTVDGVDEDGNAVKVNEFYNKATGQAISSSLGG